MGMEHEKKSTLIPIEEAQARILENLPETQSELTGIAHACGRYALQTLLSTVPLPLFDNSAMDGYAVSHSDLKGATPEKPVVLHLQDMVRAGQAARQSLKSGNCIRVFTGAPVPVGTTAVVMQEDTREFGREVQFLAPPKPWEFVRFRGEDIKAGDVIINTGEQISSRHIAVLASVGEEKVLVGKAPRISILVTGDELATPGAKLESGQIYESNGPMIRSMVQSSGGKIVECVRMGDNLDSLQALLTQFSQKSEIILTTGGISVGKFDLVKAAWEAAGGYWDTSRVRMKPGKPFSIGRKDSAKCLLLALPGNPVSAAMTFTLFVYPAIRRLSGAALTFPLPQYAPAGQNFSNQGPRTEFARIRLDSKNGTVISAGPQGSHHLRSLAQSDGFIRIDNLTEIKAGDLIPYFPWPFM